MKIKNIFKIMFFILISGVLILFLAGNIKVNASEHIVDTSYEKTLFSINEILEKNKQYDYVNSIVKNIELNNTSRTLHVFGLENNDKQIISSRDKRLKRIEKIINLHKINFLNYDFNLL